MAWLVAMLSFLDEVGKALLYVGLLLPTGLQYNRIGLRSCGGGQLTEMVIR